MIARSFKSVAWVAAIGFAALICYMFSLKVAEERAGLDQLDAQIGQVERSIRTLRTELGTRGRVHQLQHWAAADFGFTSPGAGQFLDSETTLARLEMPVEASAVEAPVRMAAAPAQAPQPAQVVQASAPAPAAAPARPAVRQAAVTPQAAERPLLRQAALARAEAPAAARPAAATRPAPAAARTTARAAPPAPAGPAPAAARKPAPRATASADHVAARNSVSRPRAERQAN